ncbi:MAG TPA: hypothetical protein VNZ22_21635 [Bacillota bacterium]|nr:hypothetical protein [Bacillota bacterium]
MNAELDKRLERAIDRELKALPELVAPASLPSRVLARVAQRTALPWHRQGWQMWPVPLQAAFLVLLLGLFGGLCLAAWQLPQVAGVAAATRTVAGWFSGVNAVCSALTALVGAGSTLVKQLGTGLLIGGLMAAAVGYGLCVGLTTVYVRLALARR